MTQRLEHTFRTGLPDTKAFRAITSDFALLFIEAQLGHLVPHVWEPGDAGHLDLTWRR
jgi:hypothetical protein